MCRNPSSLLRSGRAEAEVLPLESLSTKNHESRKCNPWGRSGRTSASWASEEKAGRGRSERDMLISWHMDVQVEMKMLCKDIDSSCLWARCEQDVVASDTYVFISDLEERFLTAEIVKQWVQQGSHPLQWPLGLIHWILTFFLCHLSLSLNSQAVVITDYLRLRWWHKERKTFMKFNQL